MNIRKILPKAVIHAARIIKYALCLLPEYIYWFKKDLSQSSLFPNKESRLSSLMIMSHVLEKGITMPDRHLGFGYDRVRKIIKACDLAISDYSPNHVEIQSTLKDLEQYLQIHESSQYQLPVDIYNNIIDLLKYKEIDTLPCYESTPEDFFKVTKNFYEFAHSRHSIRWYANEEINKDDLMKAIELAQTAPSACNRQSTRIYVIGTSAKKEAVLRLQNGNRGFGYLADKILLITSEMKCWSYKTRTSAYLDAGIFTQNMLYALHFYKMCACTLNAHLTIKQRRELQKTVGFSDSEIPVVFISIGKAPAHFMVAGSQRLQTEQICTFV